MMDLVVVTVRNEEVERERFMLLLLLLFAQLRMNADLASSFVDESVGSSKKSHVDSATLKKPKQEVAAIQPQVLVWLPNFSHATIRDACSEITEDGPFSNRLTQQSFVFSHMLQTCVVFMLSVHPEQRSKMDILLRVGSCCACKQVREGSKIDAW